MEDQEAVAREREDEMQERAESLGTEVLRLRKSWADQHHLIVKLGNQRDTLLAAGKRYLYALSVANGTTGPDDRQDALEGLEAAISEVEGEK